MSDNRAQQRLQALFADIERLAADPRGNTPEIRCELESLRARLLELEELILKEQTCDTKPHEEIPASPTPVVEIQPVHAQLYEKDKITYAFSNEKLGATLVSAQVMPHDQIVVTTPLVASGQVIGEVQIVPPSDRSLTADEMLLTNSIAQQASVQIQNLRLLAEAERSRMQAESATRQFIHEGWDAYLDAVQRSERIGFTYDQAALAPYTDPLRPASGIQAPLKVMEEQVGALYIEPESSQTLTEAERDMVNAVAAQVAQQVENIRLLADASRARAQAEEAMHRLIRENWQEFAKQSDESDLGFVYDTLDVRSIKEVNFSEEVALSEPLVIGGETIGQLAIAGLQNLPADAAVLLSKIAAQTSIHLETLRLTEELRRRAHELRELDRLKSGFLANMSHELRTPLNSILGFADVMLMELDGPLTQNMNEDLRLIQKNGQHLLHLINDVLDMAKIESGRMNLNPERFKLHNALEEVNSITSTLASEKNLSLLIEPDSDRDIEIYADSTRLRQVMINLVNNAIKFTEHGKVAIRAIKKDDATVLITVKDTGIGIPPEKLELVFQEFTQVDTSTTRKAGGTGLGLPISRRLIEMHGGRLWAESTGIPGEGSAFVVELPIEAQIKGVEPQTVKRS
ncbi:MAG: ATP-binding protein [Chloroflexota bacterium]